MKRRIIALTVIAGVTILSLTGCDMGTSESVIDVVISDTNEK